MREIEIVGISAERLVTPDDDQRAREKDDADHIKRLSCSVPQDWPPLVVTPAENGNYLIVDGLHRYEAGVAGIDNGDGRTFTVTEFACQVVELEDDECEYDIAVKANIGPRALPFSIADRKVYAVSLHIEDPDLSMRAIGREAGLTHHTVIAAIENAEKKKKPRPKSKQFPKFLTALVNAGKEGKGVMGLGDRRTYIANCILGSKNPEEIVKTLDDWLDPMIDGLELAREKLEEKEE